MTDVILVNEFDQPIGTAEKLLAHRLGLLHRAFSIFVLRRNQDQWETLLQQRQIGKYHSSGLWSNTCCSHPQPDEDIITAGTRRLQEELGFTVPLTEISVFTYRAELPNTGLIEHEVDHVLLGYFTETSTINPDPKEVMDFRWISLHDAKQESQANPTLFTPWFAEALQTIINYTS